MLTFIRSLRFWFKKKSLQNDESGLFPSHYQNIAPDIYLAYISLFIFACIAYYSDAWDKVWLPLSVAFVYISVSHFVNITFPKISSLFFTFGGIGVASFISWYWGAQSMTCNYVLGITLAGLSYFVHDKRRMILVCIAACIVFTIDLFLLDKLEVSFLARQPFKQYEILTISPWVFFLSVVFCFVFGVRLVIQMQKSEAALEKMVVELKSQNENLNQVNEELDKFVYSAAHDLRAPLTSVLGLVDLMEKQTTDSTMNLYLGLQRKSVEKLDTFIKDIVEYSRNSRLHVEINEIDIKELISATFQHYHYMENAQSITESVQVIGKPIIWNDKKRLEIILNNLISNAIKYADMAKKQPTIEVIVTVENTKVKIEVKDNGQGIDKQHLDKIFDIFYRANKLAVGSGIGLYIAKEALKKMEGEIFVESEIGKGTVFMVIIPNLSDKTLT